MGTMPTLLIAMDLVMVNVRSLWLSVNRPSDDRIAFAI